jgi:hypothetical protein
MWDEGSMMKKRIGAIATLLALGLGSAARGDERYVDIDLLSIHGDNTLMLTVARGEPFHVSVINRAPSARYRMTTDFRNPEGGMANRGTPHDQRELPVATERDMAVFKDHPCTPFMQLWKQMLQLTDEAPVRAAVEAVRNATVPPACEVMKKSFFDPAADRFTRSPYYGPTYELVPGGWVSVTIERLDPTSGAVMRTWRARIVAPAPKLEWSYPSEEAWLVGETARDIAEMLVFKKDGSLPGGPAFEIAPGADPKARSYQVHVRLRGESFGHEIVLDEHPWSPGSYAAFAGALAKRLGIRPTSSLAETPSSLDVLADLRAVVIAKESQRASERLKGAMADPGAHEQAALVLGAFGLREAAGQFSDARLVLCRMTAHLALARALRGGARPGADGAVAEAALLALAGRQADALASLDALEKEPSPAQRAWTRALRIRSTHDWRILQDARETSLLERLEHYRALDVSADGAVAFEFLSTIKADPLSDWGRVGMMTGGSVEAGNLFADSGLALELRETEEVWKAFHGTAIDPAKMVEVLNVPPARCVARDSGTPRIAVVSWGLWAGLLQRHLCHAIDYSYDHKRRTLDAPEEAAAFFQKAASTFGGLLLYPALRVEVGPLHGPTGSKEVEGACRAVAEILYRSPERVPAVVWNRLASGWCSIETTVGTVPAPQSWLPIGPPQGTAFDVDERIHTPSAVSQDLDFFEALHRLAPYERLVAEIVVARRALREKADNEAAWGPLAEFDLQVMRKLARAHANDPDAHRRIYEKIAAVNPEAHFELAEYLVHHGRPADEIVRAFENGIRTTRSEVSLSNHAAWLADYYFDHGEKDRALALAQRAAGTSSGAGLRLQARLMERMGRYDEAESWYRKLAERYPDVGEVDLGCYYLRYEHRVGDGKYWDQAAAGTAKLFPEGLRRVTLAEIKARPPRPRQGVLPTPDGVYVDAGQSWQVLDLRSVGARPGDLIIAVDGYRIHNADQDFCALTLTPSSTLRLIVRRNGEYEELSGPFSRVPY